MADYSGIEADDDRSPQLFLSRRLLAECRTFVAFAAGRTGAANGSHDDCFMEMAVAQSVRQQSLAERDYVSMMALSSNN